MPQHGRSPHYFHTTTTVELRNINFVVLVCSTYDHRTLRIRLHVRSAIYKQCTGGLVVRWVTTSESPLLYVFASFSSMTLLR